MENETINSNLDGDDIDSPDDRPKRSDRLRKGAYLFPNLLTSAGLMAGFLSISKSMDGNFIYAAWAIVLAGFFDGTDGKIARLTKTTSEFGIQYDSLADLISFGVAPAILIYQFALRHSFSPGLGWTVALLFTISGALRLARFNVQAGADDGKWFCGMPIPAGAGIIASTVLFLNHIGWVKDNIAQMPGILLILTLITSLLMVSRVPYWSMKDKELFKKHTFGMLFAMIVLMVIIIREPETALFIVGQIYLFSGLGLIFYKRRRVKREQWSDVD